MSTAAVAAIKAAILALTDESTRKKIGWVLVAILSPIIVIIALICSIFSATSQQNVSTVELCFHGGIISSEVTPEYRQYVLEMRESFSTLDSMVDEINAQLEDDNSLDANRVKAIFYVLYFGAQQPDEVGLQSFVDCFVTYTEGIRTVIDTDQEGNEVEVEETYQIPHLIEDLSQVYERIRDAMGVEVTPSHQANADNIYNLIVYGSPGGSSGGWFPGADVPFIGVDGFCSPIGAGWESVVTSEFGYRSDPFTGETRGHTGMDLAVPTGTPIRAALPGTVTVSQYNNEKVYYIIDGVQNAILENRQIQFQYYEYTQQKERVLKHNGYFYKLDPYALEWKNDHYYLIGYSHKHHGMAHFRVDRLAGIEILESTYVPQPDFDVADYTNKMIDMFAAGHTVLVELLCENRFMKTIVDDYGEAVPTHPYDSEHFVAQIEVNPSGTFYGWVFKFMGGVKITAPQKCVEEMARIARTFL